MKRSEMICSSCIKSEGEYWRLSPAPVPIEDLHKHWCAQGQWEEWSERYDEMEPFYWGEWED
jgi:hypothetical protein